MYLVTYPVIIFTVGVFREHISPIRVIVARSETNYGTTFPLQAPQQRYYWPHSYTIGAPSSIIITIISIISRVYIPPVGVRPVPLAVIYAATGRRYRGDRREFALRVHNSRQM